jgi:hypothetical protein
VVFGDQTLAFPHDSQRLFMYRFLCGHLFSFSLGSYLGVGLWGHMVIYAKRFDELFPKLLYRFAFPPHRVGVLISAHSCQHSRLVGMRRSFILVSICISLMTTEAMHLSISLLAIVHKFWSCPLCPKMSH